MNQFQDFLFAHFIFYDIMRKIIYSQKNKQMKTKPIYGNLTADQVGGIIGKLGGENGALKFLRNEFKILNLHDKPDELSDAIYITVTSDGTTEPEWINRLKAKGCWVTEGRAKGFLLSEEFKPTKGVTTKIAILRRELFRGGRSQTMRDVSNFARKHKLQQPNMEVACLLREKLTDNEIEQMGLWWIIIMHKPVIVDCGPSYIYHTLLGLSRTSGLEMKCLDMIYGGAPDDMATSDSGFAFVSP